MRTYCRTIIKQFYSSAFVFDEVFENQIGEQREIANRIEELIGKDTKFHFGPDDEQASTHTPLCLSISNSHKLGTQEQSNASVH